MDYHEIHVRLLFDSGKEEREVDVLYQEWIEILESIRGVDPVLRDWYCLLKATPEAVTYADVFGEGDIVIQDATGRARKYNRGYEGKGLVNFRAWSQKVPAKGAREEEEELLSKVSCSSGSPNMKSLFHLTVRRLRSSVPESYWEVFAEIARQLVEVKQPVWLDIFPEAYSEHAVFPHRQWVGWMAVVPDVDLTGEMPFLAHGEYIPGVGTLIVTTKEYCDDLNPEHVKLGQAAEIFLADRGLLPERGR